MKHHIAGFDTVRAIAIALVILSHVGVTAQLQASGVPILPNLFTVFDANFGVRLFFALSGFLITSLLIAEFQATGRVNIPAFMTRRALRILPLYFIAVLMVWILARAGIASWNREAVIYATFFAYNFLPADENVNYLSHLWSLAVEEQFYLFWPILFMALYPRGILVPLALVIIAACLVVLHLNPSIAAWTIPAIYPIMIGALAAIMVQHSWFRRAAGSTAAGLAFCVLVASPIWWSSYWAPHISIAGAAGIIVWIALNQHRRAVRWLDFAPVAYIGKISYGLYIWQGLFTGNGPYRDNPGWPPDVWTGLLLTIAVAPISYHLFERPILRLKHRIPWASPARSGRQDQAVQPSSLAR